MFQFLTLSGPCELRSSRPRCSWQSVVCCLLPKTVCMTGNYQILHKHTHKDIHIYIYIYTHSYTHTHTNHHNQPHTNTQTHTQSIFIGYFPGNFKQEHVNPLLKKKILPNDNLKNCRHVSNISFISKVFEMDIATRLGIHINSNNLSNVFQSAYKQLHSTESVPIKVHYDIT